MLGGPASAPLDLRYSSEPVTDGKGEGPTQGMGISGREHPAGGEAGRAGVLIDLIHEVESHGKACDAARSALGTP